MNSLILVRHGQSDWNAENKFTGWVDAQLSEKGKEEAKLAGKLIKDLEIHLVYSFTSFLKRAKNTLEIILDTLDVKKVKIEEAWELNERHYGSLTGLNKKETESRIGMELFKTYRRSWKIAPPEIEANNINLKFFSNLNHIIPKNNIPSTESLKNTHDRVVPYYKKKVFPLIKKNQNVLVVAHGNSLRALCKNLFKINDEDINDLEIPTGNPMQINFEKNQNILNAKYLDSGRRKKIILKEIGIN